MMKPPPEQPPLPRVPAPPLWSWRYFRVRYLPAATCALAALAGIWLWSANLPGPEHTVESTASTTASQTNIAFAEWHETQEGQPGDGSGPSSASD